jgi:hypothetical protein
MIQPGDIVKVNGIDKEYDGMGFTWLTTESKRSVRYLTRLDHANLKTVRENIVASGENKLPFVCVPGRAGNAPWVMHRGYEHLLRFYYYQNDGGIRKERLDEVLARWTEITSAPDGLSCRPGSQFDATTCWNMMELEGKWVMPVLASSYCHVINGETSWTFCPTPPPELIGSTCPPWYKSDSREFPVVFSGQLHPKDGRAARRLVFVLHGFLRPEHWHYKFWKHPVSGTKTAQNGERERWKAVLANSIPSASLFSDHGCKERLLDPKKKKGRCEPCALTQFEKVHIRAGRVLREYIESCVTFFAEAATMEIRWKEKRDGVLLADIAASKPHGPAFYRFLSLKGVSYDWGAYRATVYLYPCTYYFRRSSLPLWSKEATTQYGQDRWEGRIDNVTRTS